MSGAEIWTPTTSVFLHGKWLYFYLLLNFYPLSEHARTGKGPRRKQLICSLSEDKILFPAQAWDRAAVRRDLWSHLRLYLLKYKYR